MIELIDLVRIMKMIGCNIIQKIIQIFEFDPTLLTRFYCLRNILYHRCFYKVNFQGLEPSLAVN